jgi:hypothetical protein
MARAIRDGAETYNRRDREAFLVPFDPKVEFNILGQGGGLDFDDRSRGHEGLRRFWGTIDEAFEDNWLEQARSPLLPHPSRARARGARARQLTCRRPRPASPRFPDDMTVVKRIPAGES